MRWLAILFTMTMLLVSACAETTTLYSSSTTTPPIRRSPPALLTQAPVPMASPTTISSYTSIPTSPSLPTTLATDPPSSDSIQLVSRNETGSPISGVTPRISADGQYIVFRGANNVYIRDLRTKSTNIIPEHDLPLWKFAGMGLAISGSGNIISFFAAPNLSASTSTPSQCSQGAECAALFTYSTSTSQVQQSTVVSELVPVLSTALSFNGEYIAFGTHGVEFDGIYLYSGTADTITRISDSYTGEQAGGTLVDISADGRYIVFASDSDQLVTQDTNGVSDVFLFDRSHSTIRRISETADGQEGDYASGFQRVPNTGGASEGGLAISADGRYIIFMSAATNLVDADFSACEHWSWTETEFPACRHIYLFDQQLNMLELISVSQDGTPAAQASEDGDISADGRFIVFSSRDNDLILRSPATCQYQMDADLCPQVYLRDRRTSRTYLVSSGIDDEWPNGASYEPTISDDGRYITFTSLASNITSTSPPEDVSGILDRSRVYVVDILDLIGQKDLE